MSHRWIAHPRAQDWMQLGEQEIWGLLATLEQQNEQNSYPSIKGWVKAAFSKEERQNEGMLFERIGRALIAEGYVEVADRAFLEERAAVVENVGNPVVKQLVLTVKGYDWLDAHDDE